MNETERLVDLKLQLREISKQISDLKNNDIDGELTALTARRGAVEKEISAQQKLLRLSRAPEPDPSVLWLATGPFT